MRFVTVVCALICVVGALAAAQAVPDVDQSCPVQIRPVPHRGQPPTDDSMWVMMDSVSIGAPPVSFWRGLCLDPNGINFWVTSGDGSTIIQKRDLATGSLVSSFPGHVPEGPYGIIRFGDSLCVTSYAAGHLDVYDTLGNFSRTVTSPIAEIRGIDWDGSKFWVTSTNSCVIFTVSQSGALLKTLTPTVAPVWVGSFTLDRTVPNRVWLAPSTPGVDDIHYCSFDTAANTYTILATFNQPTGGGGYPGGLAFLGPVAGGSYIYDIGRSGTWLWRVKVHEPQGFKVLLGLADNYGPQVAADIMTAGAGAFSAVDYVDWRTGTLRNVDSVYNVAGYQVILTWPNYAYFDSVGVGDSLAKYVEMHGGVVSPVWCEYGPGNHMGGRYMTRYNPVPMGGNLMTLTSLGTVHQPGHPIMQGVSTVAGTYVTAVTTIKSSTYASRIADWSTGQVECATYDSLSYRTAFLGFYPNSYTDLTLAGDWMTQLVNALKWVHYSAPTGVEEPEVRPENRLASCGANPFRNEARVGYALPRATRVSLTVFTAAGRLVRTLADGNQAPGLHQAVWDGRDDLGREAGRGVYYCRLQAGGLGGTTKLVKIE